MPTIDPSKARIVRDIKNYRKKIKDDPNGVGKEVKEHLTKKDPNKYPNPTDADIVKSDAYRDFASWQGAGNPTNEAILPNRLGGKLDVNKPNHLNNVPKPTPGKKVDYTPLGKAKVTVEVLQNGAVVHKDANGNEIEAVHDYMHGIFNNILYDAKGLLDNINNTLDAYATKFSREDPAQLEAGAYLNAVNAFNEYFGSLQPGGNSPYSGAFNFVGIDPVVTNEGFIVSCRVKLNWKNPYHSSSTITIP